MLAPFPDLTAHVEGREIQLVSQHEIGGMPSKVKKMDSDAVYLARAAHIVRRETLKIKKLLQRHIFTRMSGKCCSCLLAITLVGMIIKGPTTKAEPSESQACLSIAQLIVICHDSVNSKGLFIVRTRLPPRVYSLSPKSSKYKDVHRPSGVTV